MLSDNNYEIDWTAIKRVVYTAPVFLQDSEQKVPFGRWCVCRAPARLDLAGGWTDTPPITYEHGGKVLNVALKINGMQPIGAKCRRIDEPIVKLSTFSSFDHKNEMCQTVICSSLADFESFSDPTSPCALLKACMVYTGIIGLDDRSRTLGQNLNETFGGDGKGAGIELHSWSSLPQGTGLGSSSILAGTILQALVSLVGKRYDMNSLVHAVLQVEQIFTTGGGWQEVLFEKSVSDNVGGFVPGIKLAESTPSSPLNVTWNTIDIDPSFLSLFESCLLMIYTGHTRLAKNLLQTVLGHWAERTKEIVDVFDSLVTEAEESALAFKQGSLATIGHLLTSYFAHKRFLSSTTLDDPPILRKIIEILSNDVHGYALAGAGGGGFLALVLKEDVDRTLVVQKLKEHFSGEETLVWEVQVDQEGLTVEIM